jgi:hypothetical protein
VIERSLDYRVDWSSGIGEATLTITYTHPITQELDVCDPAPRYGDSYSDLFDRCYFDYIRLYAPPGSMFSDIEGAAAHSGSSAVAEGGLQQFGGFLVLPPGHTQKVAFVYTLPPSITPETYRLRIQRQAGTPPLPVTVTVNGTTVSTVIDGNTWELQPAALGKH